MSDWIQGVRVKSEKVVEDAIRSTANSSCLRMKRKHMTDGWFHFMAFIKCRCSKNILRLSKGRSSLATGHLAKRHLIFYLKCLARPKPRRLHSAYCV